MQSTFIDKFTRGFFWFGFCVFLGASIPHIAAYYRHFDPNATPGSFEDMADWTIGYLIAIVIDVTDVLVSIAVLKALNSGARKRDLLGYWAFILFVMALSWFVNWQYNIVYQTGAFAKADSYQMFNLSVGAINPVVGSAFQLLLLVYTAMAHKFTVQPVKKSAEQLRMEADELEQVAMQQARIDAVKKMQNDSKVEGFIDTIGQAKDRAKALFGKSQNEAQVFTPDAMNEDENVHEGRTTDPLPADESETMSSDISTSSPVESNIVSNTEYVTEEMPKVTSMRPSRKPVNIARAKQKVTKLLAKYPDATQSIIAQKAGVSRGYVSQVRKELATAQ